MKKIMLTGFITCLLLVGTAGTHQVFANPIVIVVKAIAKKVIKAMDLAVQRAQNATIKLQNAQKALENALSKLKLKEIAEWGEKQRGIFKTYYDELWKVKSIISYYQRIKDILQDQVQLVQEYKRAYSLIKKDPHFTATELVYITEVYTGILEESAKNIDQLMLVINSFSTQMSDSKRLELIHGVSNQIDENLSHLRQFTNQNTMLSVERSRDTQEALSIKKYYGIE